MAVEVTALDAGFGTVELPTGRDGLWRMVAAMAGGVFVAALAIGAVLAPAGPGPFAARMHVHEYFVSNYKPVLQQSYFIHGLAGVAIVVLAVALWRSFADVPRSRVARRVLIRAHQAEFSFIQPSRDDHHQGDEPYPQGRVL